MGLWLKAFKALSSAPCWSSSFTAEGFKREQARWRGVLPLMVLLSTEAPASRRADAASDAPRRAARCRGVNLGWFGRGLGMGLGLVRFGSVWFGFSLVWFGLVWFGLARFGSVWCGLLWFGLVWFGLVWFSSLCVALGWFGLAGV